MVKTCVITLRVIEGPNARDQLRSEHSNHSLWKSKRMLATYMRCMRNDNLETTIAGSSYRRQNLVVLRYFHPQELCWSVFT